MAKAIVDGVRAELKLAWAKQEAALRTQRRGEARRSEAHMRMQDALSKLTGDPNMKLTQGQVRST